MSGIKYALLNERDKAIRSWMETNEPAAAEDFDAICTAAVKGNVKAVGMLFLLHIGYEAGRQFQAEHPDEALSDWEQQA